MKAPFSQFSSSRLLVRYSTLSVKLEVHGIIAAMQHSVSFIVCVHRVGPPSAARNSLQCDDASVGGMDGAANRGSLSLGQCTGLFVA